MARRRTSTAGPGDPSDQEVVDGADVASDQGTVDRPPRDRRPLIAVAVSVVALVVALATFGVVVTRPSVADVASCRTAAWDSLPPASALPAGWSPGATNYGVDSVGITLVGVDASTGSTAPLAYVNVSCYGDAGQEAAARSQAAAVAAGGSDLPFSSLGDASAAVQDPNQGTISVWIVRGPLVASIAASGSVASADLTKAATAVDEGMRVALATGAPASAGPATPTASIAPATSASPGASPSAGSSLGTSPSPSSSPALAGSPEPSPSGPSHVAPDLEALLPQTIDGTAMSTQSGTGTSAVASGAWGQALVDSVTGLGKTSDDLQIAISYDPNASLQVYVFAFRLAGVDGATLKPAVLQSWLKAAPSGVSTSAVTISGKSMTKVSYGDGGADDYIYDQADVVYDIETADVTLATAAAAELP
jgi:hypothetical protein